MNNKEKIDTIYEFVVKMEDFYYDKLGSDSLAKDTMHTLQATSFQRVRYFIEELEELR